MSKNIKTIFRVNTVIFMILGKIPGMQPKYEFYELAEISNLELDLKLKKIIFKVHSGIFDINKKSQNSP